MDEIQHYLSPLIFITSSENDQNLIRFKNILNTKSDELKKRNIEVNYNIVPEQKFYLTLIYGQPLLNMTSFEDKSFNDILSIIDSTLEYKKNKTVQTGGSRSYKQKYYKYKNKYLGFKSIITKFT